MMENDRRQQLRVFLRVGFFAIATALSAVVLIRTLAFTLQIQFAQQQLATAQSAGEALRQKNQQLLALSSLQNQHHARAIRNEAYVGRYYELCRVPTDLPQLKTDFIVRQHKVYRPCPAEFAFSVPEGGHSLKVAIEKIAMGGMGGTTTIFSFPLLPSSGYFIRIKTDAEAENESAQLFLELTSNHADFKPVRQPLPCSIMLLDALLRGAQSDNLAPLNEAVDEHVITAFNLRRIELFEPRGAIKNMSYPNSVVDSKQVFGLLEHGVELADCRAVSSKAAFNLRLSVVSDAPECVSAERASTLGTARGRLQPYTGTGRFYVRPKN